MSVFRMRRSGLTQKLMADLFQTTVANINIHIKNIFDEENSPAVQLLSFANAAADSKNIHKVYNLDRIISVGYRV